MQIGIWIWCRDHNSTYDGVFWIVVAFAIIHDAKLEPNENIYVEWGLQLKNIFEH